ncbi:MAG: hypothetical protein B6D62_03410 [Candidatus Cloacimonas sp. 4484_275]|nr:MAG: hypothetical protein B6D62_03410 [Candidatus Cloacimonas sp. 4484_275]
MTNIQVNYFLTAKLGGKMKRIFVIILFAALMMNVFAEIGYFNPNFKLPSLFNPNKIKMSHSISFMSGVSANNKGFYQSVYTNHISYNFNPKLKLQLDLNFVNNGTMNFNRNFALESNHDNKSMILPDFSLTYKPTENMTFSFEFRHFNSVSPYSYDWRW